MTGRLRILVTGSAGFIGHHMVLALYKLGYEVTGLDIINNYYDPELKYSRLSCQGGATIPGQAIWYGRAPGSTSRGVE